MTTATQPQTDSKIIAGEILKQLGGNRFIAMIGAKNFVYDDKAKDGFTISFSIMRNSSKIKFVRVILTVMDTYTMEFINQKFEVVKTVEGVYNDMLQSVFTTVTGLHTHL